MQAHQAMLPPQDSKRGTYGGARGRRAASLLMESPASSVPPVGIVCPPKNPKKTDGSRRSVFEVFNESRPAGPGPSGLSGAPILAAEDTPTAMPATTIRSPPGVMMPGGESPGGAHLHPAAKGAGPLASPPEPKARRKAEPVGNYLLGDLLGKGQFGRVYRGVNSESGQFVAIKQLRSGKMDESILSSFEAEIKLLERLNNENVVRYLGAIRTRRHLNLVIEYCDGGSLQDLLKKFGRLPERLVAVYILQTLNGLSYLHQEGVIHRDIKGANILLTKGGLVKLADFGISMNTAGDGNGTISAAAGRRSADDEDDFNAGVGSPYWMAPEVIQLEDTITARADIWSLGSTVIELLTGEPPYFSFQPMGAIVRIVRDEHPPLPELASPGVKALLLRCFQKDPSRRASAQELLQHPFFTAAVLDAPEEPGSEAGSTGPSTPTQAGSPVLEGVGSPGGPGPGAGAISSPGPALGVSAGRRASRVAALPLGYSASGFPNLVIPSAGGGATGTDPSSPVVGGMPPPSPLTRTLFPPPGGAGGHSRSGSGSSLPPGPGDKSLLSSAMAMAANASADLGGFAHGKPFSSGIQFGCIRIYGDTIRPDSPFKTIYVAETTTASEVVALVLRKYSDHLPLDMFSLYQERPDTGEIRQLPDTAQPLRLIMGAVEHLGADSPFNRARRQTSQAGGLGATGGPGGVSGVSREVTMAATLALDFKLSVRAHGQSYLGAGGPQDDLGSPFSDGRFIDGIVRHRSFGRHAPTAPSPDIGAPLYLMAGEAPEAATGRNFGLSSLATRDDAADSSWTERRLVVNWSQRYIALLKTDKQASTPVYVLHSLAAVRGAVQLRLDTQRNIYEFAIIERRRTPAPAPVLVAAPSHGGGGGGGGGAGAGAGGPLGGGPLGGGALGGGSGPSLAGGTLEQFAAPTGPSGSGEAGPGAGGAGPGGPGGPGPDAGYFSTPGSEWTYHKLVLRTSSAQELTAWITIIQAATAESDSNTLYWSGGISRAGLAATSVATESRLAGCAGAAGTASALRTGQDCLFFDDHSHGFDGWSLPSSVGTDPGPALGVTVLLVFFPAPQASSAPIVRVPSGPFVGTPR
ncbi:STE/STE11/CDC15 protein kinase [Fonticula alba]|uniref:STE/STE11/CDC15 protein kinase n=1 Tax=Fonticula alba TaxID=691883 RepID=A0A058ZG07_FONAL|nr:STE/STE11/CDC15 protein kinase [Fonticula alba]KCV73294.1 STE/STE11/CDC15 protein kinase [Fonticula alba]|eukprot:XP_009492995.1 STE/STE11/CDC15 protein kinase [Fonticula alba]